MAVYAYRILCTPPDIRDAGTVLAVGCGLSALVSFIFLVGTIISGARGTTAVPLFTRTLPLQAGVLAFLSLWIFSCVIPFDVFYANDDIGIDAGVLGVHVESQIVDQVLDVLGLSRRYRDYDFRGSTHLQHMGQSLKHCLSPITCNFALVCDVIRRPRCRHAPCRTQEDHSIWLRAGPSRGKADGIVE